MSLSIGRSGLFHKQWGTKRAHYCIIIKSSRFDQLLWPVHESTSRGHAASVKLLLSSTYIPDSSLHSSIYSLYSPILLSPIFVIPSPFWPFVSLSSPSLIGSRRATELFLPTQHSTAGDRVRTSHSHTPPHAHTTHSHLLPSPSILVFFSLFFTAA